MYNYKKLNLKSLRALAAHALNNENKDMNLVQT